VENLAATPRFGHTRDISVLFQSDGEDGDSNDYVLGLAVIAGIVGACFLFFMMIILIFMCCGKRRVGFLSGRPFEVMVDDDDYNSDDSDSYYNNGVSKEKHDNASSSKKKKRSCCYNCQCSIAWIRCTFIISGILFIIFAMLMVAKGFTNLQETTRTVHLSATRIEYITSEAHMIMTESLKEIQAYAGSVRVALQEELDRDDFCPGDPELEGNPEAFDVRTQTQDAVIELRQLDNFVGEQVNAVAEALAEAGRQSETVVDMTGDVDLTDWQALLILIVFTLVPTMFVSAAILSHFDIEAPALTAILDFAMMPLFIFMVLFCVFVSCAMLVGASANSDFCLPGGRPDDAYEGGSPDASVLRFLDAQGFTVGSGGTEQNELVRQVADYYVHQCQNVEDPYYFLTQHLPDIAQAQRALQAVNTKITEQGLILELSLYCNRDFDRFGTLLAEMHSTVNVFLTAVYRILGLVSCQRIVPIYHGLVYDTTCRYTVSAVMWVFASALIMATFGVVMLLLRAGYKPTKYVMVAP